MTIDFRIDRRYMQLKICLEISYLDIIMSSDQARSILDGTREGEREADRLGGREREGERERQTGWDVGRIERGRNRNGQTALNLHLYS